MSDEDYDEQETFFAFCYPYTYNECQKMVNDLQQIYTNDPEIYFNSEVFTRSSQRRKINLITISSHNGKLSENESCINNRLFPNRGQTPRAFKYFIFNDVPFLKN